MNEAEKSLLAARREIEDVDREMAALFERRMALSETVAEAKTALGKAVFDPEREAALLERNRAFLRYPAFLPYYETFLKTEFALSKRYQRQVLGAFPEWLTFGVGALAKVGEVFDLDRKVLIVTDSGIPKEYVEAVLKVAKEPVLFMLDEGETSKNLKNWERLLSTMEENGFDRGSAVVAVGGGMVSDLSGFAAASFLRGIDFYTVPTSLLAQVDAAVGGKTAVDFGGYKNAVGAFYPAKGVLVDPEVLKTLPERHRKNGLAEAVKTATLFDPELFEKLENGTATDEELARRCLLAKLAVVEEDEKEKGSRRLLNFGHTLGHAMESAGNFSLLHGECVALGMPPFCGEGVKKRLVGVLKKAGLETEYHGDAKALYDALLHDKKIKNGVLTAVFLPEIGKPVLKTMDEASIRALLDDFCKGGVEP